MKCHCKDCGGDWEARVADPKACPICKSYTWKEGRKMWKARQIIAKAEKKPVPTAIPVEPQAGTPELYQGESWNDKEF